MMDTLTKMNNVQQINRVEDVKNHINDLEYEEAKHIQSEKQKGKNIPK